MGFGARRFFIVKKYYAAHVTFSGEILQIQNDK
jgi:hypothetical protein